MMRRTILSIAFAIVTTGCGSGAGVVPLNVPSSTPFTAGPMAPATVSISIPPARLPASVSRRPAYISSATNSMVLTPQGGSAITIPLMSTSPGCYISSGTRYCSVTASLPVGTYGITVSLYASSNGTGPVLASAAATQTIVQNTNNNLYFTLNAVVASLKVSLAPDGTFTSGVADKRTVNVTAYDPAGAIIVVGNDVLMDSNNYAVTITLKDSDTSAVTSVSPTTVGATPSILSYTGGAPNGTTITATATNALNASVAFAQTTFTVGGSPGGWNVTPTATISRYVQTLDYNTLYGEGQSMASQGQSGIVVLDFGQPWYCGSSHLYCSASQVGTYGSFLQNHAAGLPYETTAGITAAAEAFLDGYYEHKISTTQQIRLAIGTSNFCLTVSDCQTFPFNGHGIAWGSMVNDVSAYIASHGRSAQESVSGADDIEPGWNAAVLSVGSAPTKRWLDGFAAATSLPMYDYGSLDGCQNGSCANWPTEDLWEVSSSRNSYAIAEIYCHSQAVQWNDLAVWTKANKGTKLRLVGTMTASGLPPPGSPNAPCVSPPYTAAQGFQLLQGMLQADAVGTADPMTYSTDLTYNTSP